ncbi:carbon monoxide dehydrogenase [Mycobacterium kansasii]|uniref:(2Fe-2S)-binding protein n=1 Tax=Mycobacterium kansasii TaxID=1768 RepID=UPI000CDD90BB|nr:(2Fe-2S)-binding protein [Mycobacterium kansasii]POX89110.1 carbon monoxide dehydrogenase [Mycobacterium kansasii]POY00070.1 carbon monoxide dehydrogenase [Mycobacterium kansasii]POY02441.1 carbon monoxide dehydrogenase [Mycobacterium kansasii]POY15331.1 carbon monoxide dehydrogenase [Mycobacterium kansasii]POY22967.1 carbon monoxide dehydrogenase [Mycobacterium kansasii]
MKNVEPAGTVRFTVNGAPAEVNVAAHDRLVDVLRGPLELTGAAIGCDTAVCGACTVLLDGRTVKSCTVLAVQAADTDVVTVEGLATPDSLHVLQAAFLRHRAVQCGYCTAGMLVAAVDLLTRYGASLDEAIIRDGICGNLCRCTGYRSIISAIAEAAAEMADDDGSAR